MDLFIVIIEVKLLVQCLTEPKNKGCHNYHFKTVPMSPLHIHQMAKLSRRKMPLIGKNMEHLEFSNMAVRV